MRGRFGFRYHRRGRIGRLSSRSSWFSRRCSWLWVPRKLWKGNLVMSAAPSKQRGPAWSIGLRNILVTAVIVAGTVLSAVLASPALGTGLSVIVIVVDSCSMRWYKVVVERGMLVVMLVSVRQVLTHLKC